MKIDPRRTRTANKIKEAYLQLLEHKSVEDIAMSELARMANVSRSTLYSHFPNTQVIFDSLISDFITELQPLGLLSDCESCKVIAENGERIPFCIALHRNGKYRALTRNPKFLSNMLRLMEGEAGLKPYLEAGISEAEARVLFTFQISGCYALSILDTEQEIWEAKRQLIDRFVIGGIKAVSDSKN